MKKVTISILALATVLNLNAQKIAATKSNAVLAPKPIFKNDVDSFSYAVGMSIAESLKQSGADKINTQLLSKAMNEVLGNNKTQFTKEQANNVLQEKLQGFMKKKAAVQIQEGKNFLALNKKKAGIVELPSGMQYQVLKAGEANGVKPLAVDTVVVNYIGTLTNGTEFDNSFKRGAPATFALNGVIKGWTDILQLMPKGSTWKVFIPSDMAYGANPPSHTIPPNAVLVFEISLLDVKPAVVEVK
jgi:FKBP-type peptidyl-prolyl cis-trans isomerase FklB